MTRSRRVAIYMKMYALVKPYVCTATYALHRYGFIYSTVALLKP